MVLEITCLLVQSLGLFSLLNQCFAKVTKVLRCRIHSCCYEITHGWHRLIITRPHAKYQHDLIAVTVYCILHHIFLSTAENSHHWHTDWLHLFLFIEIVTFYLTVLLNMFLGVHWMKMHHGLKWCLGTQSGDLTFIYTSDGSTRWQVCLTHWPLGDPF